MQTVFITGASSGIGQALAKAYLQRGDRVAMVARQAISLLQALTHFAHDPSKVLCLSADVTQGASLKHAAQTCIDVWGLPDIVIANAGLSIGMDTQIEADLAVMQDLLATNVYGVAATFAPFAKAFAMRGSGQLVGIGSVAGIRGLPGHGAYCASKAGVIAYLESLRGEMHPHKVQVITICPGYIATPLTQNNGYSMPFLLTSDEFARRALQAIDQHSSYRVIPWQMGIVAKLLRLLPNPWFDRLFANRARKPRRENST